MVTGMTFMESHGSGAPRPSVATLDQLIAEAAAARGLRRLDLVAGALAGMGTGDLDDALHRLGCRLRAMAMEEELLPDPLAGPVDLSSPLVRLASLQLPGLGSGGELVTNLPAIIVAADVARVIIEAAREVLHVAEEMCFGFADRRMLMAGEEDGAGVIVSIAVRDVDEALPGSTAARASWRRACLILRALGGRPVRGYRDGMLVVAMFVPREGLGCADA